MAKIIDRGLLPVTDPKYSEGWTISVGGGRARGEEEIRNPRGVGPEEKATPAQVTLCANSGLPRVSGTGQKNPRTRRRVLWS